ncbi:MAG: hypothetical protein ACYTFT_04065, partial [Planctomycetota bacterium]
AAQEQLKATQEELEEAHTAVEDANHAQTVLWEETRSLKEEVEKLREGSGGDAELREEARTYKRALSEAEREADQLRTEFEALQEEAQELREALDEGEQDGDKLRVEVDALNLKLELAEEKAESGARAERQVAALTDALESAKEKLRRSASGEEVEGESEELMRELQDARDSLDEAMAARDHFEAENKRAVVELAETKAETEQLRLDFDKFRKTAEARVREKLREYVSAKHEMTDAYAELEAKVTSKDEELAAMRNRLDELEQDMEARPKKGGFFSRFRG